MPRKTADVQELKKKANLLLGLKGDEFTPEFRQGVIAMIEFVLHGSHNYRGFHYRPSEWDFTNTAHPDLRENYDDTRRVYY